MIFSVFQKNWILGVFLVHPTVVSVLLLASVERCSVSRMRDFLLLKHISDLAGCARLPVHQKIENSGKALYLGCCLVGLNLMHDITLDSRDVQVIPSLYME